MQKIKAAPVVIGLTVGAVTAWVMTFFTADLITIVAMGILGFMFAYGKCRIDEKQKAEKEALQERTEKEREEMHAGKARKARVKHSPGR
ncbi:MAG: hypothetical protein PUG38_06480 [Sutterellaceae bacterium]|nr:hypothetical protein [Sutterellaceae bacterium]MDY2868658.1 hypothetical protein [Mesosutterella sp.]